MENTQKAIRLTALQHHKLYMWIEKNQEMVIKQTADSLATEASEALGFEIPSFTMGKARRALGIHKVVKTKKHNKGNPVLVKAVIDLYRNLGIRIPPELAELADLAGQ